MSDAPSDLFDDNFDGEDLTAAEYALGVLDRDERAAAEARSAREPAFAETVLAWVMRLEPLIDAVPSIEPSQALWPRIETAIDRPRGQAPSPYPVVSAAARPPIPANDDPTRGARLWRAWAAGASAIAAAAILFIALRPALLPHAPGAAPAIFSGGGQGGPTLVANLALTETKASVYSITYDPVRSTLYAAPDADFSIPRARSAELWMIPADGKPRPMGIVDPSKPATMPMPPAFRTMAKERVTLAISIEPTGGSTTGLPTGPVIATGKFAAV